MRKIFTIEIAVAIALSLFLTPVAQAGDAADDSDLIIFVFYDALRADHVGVYGYPRPTTPHLDTLAGEGVRYTRAYVNAPWTRSSTASVLTGLNASRHRTETDKSKLPATIRTLAARLKAQGYTTAGFSANGNGGSLGNLHKDFDVFEDTTNTYKRKMRGKTYCCNGLPTGEFIVKRVKRWMEKDKSKKKFIFIFFVDPHDPYGAPPELERMMLGKDFKGKIRRKALWEYKNDYPEDERYSIMALYDAGIRYADKAFGQLVGYLKKRDLYDRSTIFVTGDHGEGFGEHGFYLHAHHFWEEVIHVPLVVRGPKFTGDKVERRLTQLIDVTRTITELAGADPSGLMGHSLLAPQRPDPYVISEYNEYGIHRQAIIGERYKVIWQRPADEAWYLRAAKRRDYFPSVSFGKEVVQVFDLEKDPGEKNDLAAAMPPEAATLLKKLREFVAASGEQAASPRLRKATGTNGAR